MFFSPFSIEKRKVVAVFEFVVLLSSSTFTTALHSQALVANVTKSPSLLQRKRLDSSPCCKKDMAATAYRRLF